ncbi:MAG TPA: zinc-binding dehydrogenase [Candidatus Binataceae bacterium]|nr:zinc-binding dehydrogenase [Candidatus Binataceae bacterium]
MKAIVFEQNGDCEVLKYADTPEPKAGPNDVVIQVKASACNFNDIWARRGLPGMKIILPHISGSDASGVVVETGSEVHNVKVGDEVVVHCGISCRQCDYCTRGEEFFCPDFKIWGFQTGPLDGAHGDFCKVPAVNVLPKPKNLTHVEAATMPLVLVTVWRMLVTRARIQAGDFVLVWGGAGGLGVMAIQIAKLYNARAIAVASSDDKLELCKELGAEFVLHRKKHDVFQEVRKITNGRRADIVFEHTGADTWPISMQCLKWGGTIVTCGATSGFDAHLDIRLLWNKQQNYLGSHLGNKGELMDAMRFVESGQIKPVVGKVLPLKELGRAQHMMETNAVGGKIAIIPPAAA